MFPFCFSMFSAFSEHPSQFRDFVQFITFVSTKNFRIMVLKLNVLLKMVLFKYPVFVHLGRKLILEHGLKSEVIFRQCSSRVLPVEKQIIYKQSQSVSALNNEEEKPVLRIISKPRVVNRVALIPKHETEKEDDEFDSLFEIHREDFDSDESLHGFTPKLPKALDPSTEDLSDLGTNPVPSFNIASFADKNPTIQEFVKLGVELWKVEKKAEIAKKLVSLDFEKDVKPYIQFLHDSGVPANELGAFITKNPFIFNVDLDDLRTRIRYLRAHQFHPRMISTILTKNPQWISYNTKSIDTRLGYFQNNFKLNGPEVRLVAVKLPKLITYSMMAIENKSLAIQKEMGFQLSLRKKMLMKSPRLWTKCKNFMSNIICGQQMKP